MLRIRQILFLAGLAALTTVCSCGGGGTGATSTPAPTPIAVVSKTVTPAGGTLVTPDKAVTLVVPPGAVTKPAATLSLAEFESKDVPSVANVNVVSNGVTLSVDPGAVDSTKALSLAFVLKQPLSSGTHVIGVTETPQGNYVTPTTSLSQSGLNGTVTLPISDVIAQNASAGLLKTGPYILVVPVIPAPPPAKVNLYRMDKILRFGDPDSSSSPYSKDNDFSQNWHHEVSPDWSHKHIALVIHGINNDLSNMTELAFYLKNLKDPNGALYYSEVYGADVAFGAPIADNGKLLADLLKSLTASTTTVDIFAHSQGGLVARWALEMELPGTATALLIKRLFTFSTPHLGVPTSAIDALVVNGIVVNDPGIGDLLDSSTFFKNLNGSAGSRTTDYALFSGDNFSTYLHGLGKVVHFLEQAPCDGIVPVSSAQGVGISNHARTWVVAPTYHLDHSHMRGEKTDGQDASLNLTVNGTAKLSDYIAGGGVSIGIH